MEVDGQVGGADGKGEAKENFDYRETLREAV